MMRLSIFGPLGSICETSCKIKSVSMFDSVVVFCSCSLSFCEVVSWTVRTTGIGCGFSLTFPFLLIATVIRSPMVMVSIVVCCVGGVVMIRFDQLVV